MFFFLYHIWTWQPSWSCDQYNIEKKILSLYLKAYIQPFFKWPSGFLEKQVVVAVVLSDLVLRSRNMTLLIYFSFLFFFFAVVYF